MVVTIAFLACMNTFLYNYVQTAISYQKLLHQLQEMKMDMELFRNMAFTEESLQTILDKKMDDNASYEMASMTMLINRYVCDQEALQCSKQLSEHVRQELEQTQLYQDLYERYQLLLSDLVYFPVPLDWKGNYTTSYDDSWNAARTYGGNRRHEGTDIMANTNIRGIYPIISVSDGVVEQKGWLEQGGYRIGIRSKHGAYFYYAHLYSYAPDLSVGDTVYAGQLLGFMGDTGYSKIEGTTGNFDVHLHFGIYYMEGEEEVSVNPYYILKYLEKYTLTYSYGE